MILLKSGSQLERHKESLGLTTQTYPAVATVNLKQQMGSNGHILTNYLQLIIKIEFKNYIKLKRR